MNDPGQVEIDRSGPEPLARAVLAAGYRREPGKDAATRAAG